MHLDSLLNDQFISSAGFLVWDGGRMAGYSFLPRVKSKCALAKMSFWWVWFYVHVHLFDIFLEPFFEYLPFFSCSCYVVYIFMFLLFRLFLTSLFFLVGCVRWVFSSFFSLFRFSSMFWYLTTRLRIWFTVYSISHRFDFRSFSEFFLERIFSPAQFIWSKCQPFWFWSILSGGALHSFLHLSFENRCTETSGIRREKTRTKKEETRKGKNFRYWLLDEWGFYIFFLLSYC